MFVSVCMKEKEASLWVVSVINPLDPMISMLIIFLRQDPFLTSRGFKKSWQLQNCCLHFFETNNIRVKIKLLSAAYIYLAAFFCVAQDLLKPPTSIPYLFAYKPISAISQDPKLFHVSSCCIQIKNKHKTFGYKPRPNKYSAISRTPYLGENLPVLSLICWKNRSAYRQINTVVCLTINHNPFQLESIPLSLRLQCLI